jgi:hypothetical protein
MRKTAYLSLAGLLVLSTGIGIYKFIQKKTISPKLSATLFVNNKEKEEGGDKRRLYEWKMLHDPATGEIPKDFRIQEAKLLASVKSKQSSVSFRQTINNTYTSAGPSQNGGRTRAFLFDIRNNGVAVAAGISGGIYRSTDGGSTWSFSSPINDVRIVSCFTQDPRPGAQDTLYAGTGELIGSSSGYPNAYTAGDGIYKSTDNGLTWNKLMNTSGGYPFNIIFNIKVAPNGYLYVAALNYILLSPDGGKNWFYTIRTASNPNTLGAITDIAISSDGSRYYACFSGINSRRDSTGIWTSPNGIGNWTRIAGGINGQPDSVAGWKAYNPNMNNSTGWGRTVLSVAPSNANILYVMYENSLSAAGNQSEADLFRADLSSYTAGIPSTVSWSSNRASNLTATRIRPVSEGGGSSTTFMETQGGYNMLLAVHPTSPDLVIAGGVNLYKSTNGFSTSGTFIGGLSSTTYSDPNLTTHVDFHSFGFHPSNPNRFVTGHDGGINVTNDITASTVSWSNLNNQYQTLQYYHVAIDPTAGSLTFAGGAQDNSSTYRDSKNLLAGSPLPAPTEANDHYVLIGGDGGAVGLAASSTTQYMYASVQEGDVYRLFANGALSTLTPSPISPSAAPGSEFITYFHLDQDNTNVIYYAGLNTLWRTTNATTVTSAGWTELTGVSNAVQSGNSIFSLATSRGAYAGNNSYLYIGTDNGRIYRLTNPRDAAASTAAINISPSAGLGMTTSSLIREIAVNPRNADTVLAVVSNYGVASAFWSGNATTATPTWQAVEGNISLASFRSCAIVATTTGVEYYVGTSIGLFSTTNINGASTVWTLEGPAIMQGAIVNDLVLRTADNTLLVGTHGNGMFYTIIGNVPTSVPDVVVNDKRFISSVFPTIATTGSINFRTGSATGIKTINIRVSNMSGQVLMHRTQGYQNGTLQLGPLSTGSYLLEIISDDRRYKHVQQFVKTY